MKTIRIHSFLEEREINYFVENGFNGTLALTHFETLPISLIQIIC